MFHARGRSIDDLMRTVFKQLLSGRGNYLVKSQKGISTEVFGALLELENPRARLSRSFSRAKAFSPLGELFWYLAGDESIAFISHYIPNYHQYSSDGILAKGAYGPRLFGLTGAKKLAGKSEWDRALNNLRKRPGSRNAVIQIYSNKDDRPRNKDKPCTCTIQFAIRENRLLMHTHMRSNDAYLGLPHDVFSFTMLQEIAARELGVGLGEYTHSVASLHLYQDESDSIQKIASSGLHARAQRYYDEGLHESVPMPAMPKGDPWESIEHVKNAEKAIRMGNLGYTLPVKLDPYWNDFVSLFRIHKIFDIIKKTSPDDKTKNNLLRDIVKMMGEMNSVYRLYIMDRLNTKNPPIRDLFDHADQGTH